MPTPAAATKPSPSAGVTVNDTNGGGNYNVSYINNTASTITPASLTVDARQRHQDL